MAEVGRPRFESVYEQHLNDVFGFFGYRLGTQDVAEDLTQATFERAYAAWDRYDPRRSNPRTWLIAIARNLLIDHFRREGGRRDLPLEDEDGQPTHQATVPAIDESLGIEPEIAGALARLAPRDRTIVAMKYGGDLTGPEIAEATGLSLANVQQILSRSLRAMRADLEAGAGSGLG